MQPYCNTVHIALARLTDRGYITYYFIIHLLYAFFLDNAKPESFAVLGEPSHLWGGSGWKRQSDLKSEA